MEAYSRDVRRWGVMLGHGAFRKPRKGSKAHAVSFLLLVVVVVVVVVLVVTVAMPTSRPDPPHRRRRDANGTPRMHLGTRCDARVDGREEEEEEEEEEGEEEEVEQEGGRKRKRDGG